MRGRVRSERRWPRPWWLLFLLALVASVLVIAYLLASYAVYDTLSAVPGVCHPEDAADTPQQFHVRGLDDTVTAAYAMPAPQDVEFRSRDPHIANLVLRAWWIPGRSPDGPAVILVHGVGSCRRDDNILMPAGMLHRNGFGEFEVRVPIESAARLTLQADDRDENECEFCHLAPLVEY